jgi:phosphoribosylformimino-5-aminoimidazole carboxamide ribotide isomerase
MIIYPAIDIKGGRCVRLTQGRADQETVYAENPADVAAQFQAAGSAWVHVVDLDGAFAGEPQNLAVVQGIAALGMKVQLGGGLRTRAAVERALGLGVSRVVIGTRAAESEAFVGELVQAFGEKVAVGIDAKNGQVAVKGWVAAAGMSALTLAQRMDALGVRTLIHTDIGTDGMLTGPNFPAQEAMLGAGKFRVIASGGVSRREDVIELAKLAQRQPRLDGVIVGKALYEGRVELRDLLQIAKGAASA